MADILWESPNRLSATPTEVEPGGVVEVMETSIKSLDRRGRTQYEVSVLEGAKAATNPNWLSFALLQPVEAVRGMQEFVAEWTVPEIPVDRSRVVFLFNGLEDQKGRYILQPVLQWYPQAHGVPEDTWVLRSWFVGPPRTEPLISKEVGVVQPGDVVRGILRWADGDASVSFEGFPQTELNVRGLGPQMRSSLVLESYTKSGKVPESTTIPASTVPMRVVSIADVLGGVPENVAWAPHGAWGADITDDSPGGGAVDLRVGP